MATVNATITTKKQSVPTLPAASVNVRYKLIKDGVVFSLILGGMSGVSFASVGDGVGYTVEAQRMSTQNTPIGDSATSAPFDVVTVSMTEIDVPAVVNVTI